jgi:hypothetical protein
MPLMGYTKWQNFETPLNRAMQSAENQGHSIETNFMGSHKVAAQGKMAQQDYQLTRFGAYLVAMNGDPNKPEVAAAQAYFAIQTRIAETQTPQRELSRRDLAQMIIEAEDAKEAAEAIAETERTARVVAEERIELIEGGQGYSVREFRKHYFPDVTDGRLNALLYEKNLLINQLNTRRGNDGKLRNGKQHRHPSHLGSKFFYIDWYIDPDTGERHGSTLVRPGVPETNLVAQLERWGLPRSKNTGKEIQP